MTGSARLRTPTPRSVSSWMRLRVSRTVRPSRSRVHHDHVAFAGVGQCRLQPGAVGRGTGLPVQVDPLRRDPGLLQGVDLPVQVLLGRRDPRVSQLHRRTVPEVLLVRLLRDSVVGLTCGTDLWMPVTPGARSRQLVLPGCPTSYVTPPPCHEPNVYREHRRSAGVRRRSCPLDPSGLESRSPGVMRHVVTDRSTSYGRG